MSKNKTEIRFTGFGGQGIILAAHITGLAVTIYENLNATLTQSYGPESRGGSCSAQLVISNKPIYYPHLTNPDILVALSPEGYHKYKNDVKAGGAIIIEQNISCVYTETNGADTCVLEEKLKDVKVLVIPATRIAEEIGKKVVTNMVVLGFMTAATKVVSKEAMRQAIADSVPSGTQYLNIKAFEQGYNYFSGK